MSKTIPEGVRKYRAFLFSLASLNLVAVAGLLTGAEFIKGLGLILDLFAGANAVVHASRAIGGKEDPP